MRPWIVLVALAACRIDGAFVCETSDQCRSAEGQGVCDATGFCAFADANCMSGTRYADNAGDLAGTCTAAQPPVDAAPLDAPPFDPSVCPARFDITFAVTPNVKYDLFDTTGHYGTVAQACIDSLPGATHPAIVKSAALAAKIGELVPKGYAFVGVLQDPAATMPISGWINFDGTAFDATLWSTATPVQPDDSNGIEGDHAEQAAVVMADGSIQDYVHTTGAPLLCACDGVPVAAQAMTYLASNRWAN